MNKLVLRYICIKMDRKQSEFTSVSCQEQLRDSNSPSARHQIEPLNNKWCLNKERSLIGDHEALEFDLNFAPILIRYVPSEQIEQNSWMSFPAFPADFWKIWES